MATNEMYVENLDQSNSEPLYIGYGHKTPQPVTTESYATGTVSLSALQGFKFKTTDQGMVEALARPGITENGFKVDAEFLDPTVFFNYVLNHLNNYIELGNKITINQNNLKNDLEITYTNAMNQMVVALNSSKLSNDEASLEIISSILNDHPERFSLSHNFAAFSSNQGTNEYQIDHLHAKA